MIRSVISVSLVVSSSTGSYSAGECQVVTRRTGRRRDKMGPGIFSLCLDQKSNLLRTRGRRRGLSPLDRGRLQDLHRNPGKYSYYSLNHSTNLSSQWRRSSHVDDTQSASTDSTEVSGPGEKVENRREKLFIIDMMKGGGDDQKPDDQKVMSC